jgi:hypothetical protein
VSLSESAFAPLFGAFNRLWPSLSLPHMRRQWPRPVIPSQGSPSGALQANMHEKADHNTLHPPTKPARNQDGRTERYCSEVLMLSW